MYVKNFTDYQVRATRTMAQDNGERALANYAMGLAGEAGETVDLLKKYLFHGHQLDEAALKKELGDVLWYVAALATSCGFMLQDIASENIEKLQARYPNGFCQSDSINRRE